MFSDEEVTKAWETFRKEGMRQVMELAVALRARGGTMTEDGEHVFEAAAEDGGRVWVEATGEWGHEGGNISWALDALAAHVVALRATLGARNAVLERLAYIGEHRFPDLTWKARCEELTKECNELRARAETAEADLVDAHATITELRVSNARLLAASSAFTHELDTRGGPAPGQCANPDPTTGPTCTDRGCEGQTCQYPKVKPACTCSAVARGHPGQPALHLNACPLAPAEPENP